MVGRRSGYPMSGEATRQPTALGNGVRHAPPFCPGAMETSKSSQSTFGRPCPPSVAWGCLPENPRATFGLEKPPAASLEPPPGTWPSTEIQSQLTWGTRLLVSGKTWTQWPSDKTKSTKRPASRPRVSIAAISLSQHGKAVSSGRVTVHVPVQPPSWTPNNRPSATNWSLRQTGTA